MGQVVKKANFGHPPKNKKLTDNCKVFLVFFYFQFHLFFVIFCFLRGLCFGGFKVS